MTTNEAEYIGRRIWTAKQLTQAYNEALQVMSRETLGELSFDQAQEELDKLWALHAQEIVDQFAPKTRLIT